MRERSVSWFFILAYLPNTINQCVALIILFFIGQPDSGKWTETRRRKRREKGKTLRNKLQIDSFSLFQIDH